MVLATDVGEKCLTVMVVLVFRYELWMVNLGVKGERTRNWEVEGTG